MQFRYVPRLIWKELHGANLDCKYVHALNDILKDALLFFMPIQFRLSVASMQ